MCMFTWITMDNFQMELSPENLQKYQEIIEKINCEFEKNQLLKKELETKTNQITILQFANTDTIGKVSHVDVKIFSEISEVLLLYDKEISEDQEMLECNYKYYVVEVYITKMLLQKLCESGWLVNISIPHESIFINKTVPLKNKSRIVVCLSVKEDLIDCKIKVCLVTASDTQAIFLELGEVIVNISHHFQDYRSKQKRESLAVDILQISKNYDSSLNVEEILRGCKTECQIVGTIDLEHFMKEFIKNCYHAVSSEYFSKFNTECSDYVLQFSHGLNKHEVVISSDKINIKSYMQDMPLLKKYFYKALSKFRNGDNYYKLKNMEDIVSESSDITQVYYMLQEIRSIL